MLVIAAAARADDAPKATGAGGLVFQMADRIAMQREASFISPTAMQVRYECRDDQGQPCTSRVAFERDPVFKPGITVINHAYAVGADGAYEPVGQVDDMPRLENNGS